MHTDRERSYRFALQCTLFQNTLSYHILPLFKRGGICREGWFLQSGNSMTTVELFSPDNLAVIEIIRNFVA